MTQPSGLKKSTLRLIRRLGRKRQPLTTWIVSEKFPPVMPRPAKLNHFGMSGGKDSTALLLWGLFESGYPRESIDVSFCDTGNESPVTYDYISYLEDALQIGITRIKPELDFFALAKKKKRFPSAKARFCTESLKIIPTTHYIQHLEKSCKELVLHSGVRALESDARAELAPEGYDDRFGCWVKRPLLRCTIQQVWEQHHKYGIKPNPLYAMGLARVGCFPCCMCRKDEVRKVSTLFPEVINRVEERELESVAEWGRKATGQASFFHASMVPKRFRSGDFVNTKGKHSKVATIRDVAKWSLTEKGAKAIAAGFDPRQPAFSFAEIADLEQLPMGEHARSCPSSLGMCE